MYSFAILATSSSDRVAACATSVAALITFFVLMVLPPILNWAETVRLTPAKNAAGAVSGTVSKLTDSQLGDMAQALAGAQYSQKQEYEADEFGFQFCIDYGRDPYGMSNSLNKLLQLSESEAKSSKFMQMFSSHPETQKRADRVKEKADEYVKSKQ